MKKYLIQGALALVGCATFCSCTHDDDFGGSIVDDKVKAYAEVFQEEFGTIDPNQDWGFGEESVLARTRGARTRTAYTNGNMWATQGYRVPPQLTDEQKSVVRQYFQQNKLKTYQDPQWENYFIQHVYKGGTTVPEGCPTPEKYASANGGLVVGSDHMDHLAAVFSNGTADHINNYNFAVCSTYPNVASTTGVTYDPVNSDGSHPDEIQLMLNSTTYSFGYYNSECSTGHTDYTSLVHWSTIRTWANNHNLNGDCLADGWNRSYMGFDFEQIVGDDIYEHNADGSVRYVTYGDFIDGPNYVWDGGTYATARPTSETLFLYNNKPVPMLSIKSNMYCGNNKDYTGDQGIYRTSKNKLRDDGNTEGVDCIDLTKATDKLKDGYLPVCEKGLMKWVEVVGGADGYYSDWIVTLTKADTDQNQGGDDPTIPVVDGQDDPVITTQTIEWEETWIADAGRVFCEDLGVVSASDIDFNDIVFDAYIYNKQTYRKTRRKVDNGSWEWIEEKTPVSSVSSWADIYLLAGGGTIQATIAGTNNVKGIFDTRLSDVTIVNTISSAEGSYGNTYVEYDNAGKLEGLSYSAIRDIPVIVSYGSQFLVLDAYKGAAPHKICVPLFTKWPKERAEINTCYSFEMYVKNRNSEGKYVGTTTDGAPTSADGDGSYYTDKKSRTDIWDNPKNINNLYSKNVSYTPRYQSESGWNYTDWTDAVRIVQTYDSGEVTTGGASGGYDGGAVLVRRRH